MRRAAVFAAVLALAAAPARREPADLLITGGRMAEMPL